MFLEAYPTSEAIIFERGEEEGENWFKLFIDSNGYPRADVDSQDYDIASVQWSYPLPLNQWFHLAATYDNTSDRVRLYLNNYKIGESALIQGDLDPFSGNPTIGTGLIGKIDEVHVRSDAPTTFLPTTNPTQVDATLGLWHFSEGSGTTVADDDHEEERQTATVPSTSWDNARVAILSPSTTSKKSARRRFPSCRRGCWTHSPRKKPATSSRI